MLTRLEFWREILPSEGYYCVFSIAGKKDGYGQTFHKTLEEADKSVQALDDRKVNSFIALANYETPHNRTGSNVVSLKCLFLDLDCDPNDPKKYASQGEAISDLKRFVKTAGYPRPYVVNSGNGVHVYWALTEALPRATWKRFADKLKAACTIGGMKIDPAVSGDPARVLRAVGTSNWKNPDNPLPVELLSVAPAVDVSVFRNLLNVTEEVLDAAPAKPLDDVTKSLLANKPSSFKLILKKSIEGKGCKQLLDLVENQETASEPMWRAALSIAQHCKDRNKAIHVISSRHPDYTPAATEEKASRIQGPYKCETFWTANPDGCEGCTHKGTITSPIALGRGEVEAASPQDNIVEVPVATLGEAPKTYVIPDYPFPYLRGKHGGIYVKGRGEDDEPKDELIYENDFYLVHTVDDPLEGMAGLFRLHLPQDGVREFLIPLREMTTKDPFAKRVAEQGISTIKKQMESLIAFANMSVKNYQRTNRAAKSRLQFGWADNFSSFIIGDRQVTATDIRYSPPSTQTINLVRAFRKEGTLEGWKRMVSFYNQPGLELHMFLLFAGFASPLVPFNNQRKGCVLSLYSPEAGTGKTTTIQIINSIFGHPDDLMLIKADTANAQIHRFGTMQNITPTVDEITTMTPEAVSDFLYNFLHARGKNRLINNVNGERVNFTTWATNCVVTSNHALEDKLFSKKSTPDGEAARLLEFKYRPPIQFSKEETDEVFNPLRSNYGVAGEQYMQYVIQIAPTIENQIAEMQRAVDRAAVLTQRERHWSATAATILTAGFFARNSKVLDFVTKEDFKRVYDWAVNMLREKRGLAYKASADHKLALGSFLSEHLNDTLIIDSGITLRGAANGSMPAIPPVPSKEPKGKLYIRYEPDTQLLYLNRMKFRQHCSERQVAYAAVLDQLQKDGLLVGEKKFRMGKGLQVSEPENVVVVRYVDTDGVLDENNGSTSKD